jgi:NAD(P) transhydrogenase subunit alpha
MGWAMKVGVLKESFPGERRVALVPGNVAQLEKAGFEVWIEEGAGDAAGYCDQDYTNARARVTHRDSLHDIQVLLQVRSLGANPEHGEADLELLSPGGYVVGTCDPLGNPAAIEQLARLGLNQFSLELMPRITRAQSMDVLSSMATIAGYRAVLLAASELPRIFPLLMTASGTLAAARVFVIGAGVAGLQAIATARRLGAIVQAYDLRPACREQVESLGAKFVELALEAGESEDKGGYAKQMGEEFYRLQRELMADVVAESDVVITTAAIPGRPSPLLVTADAVGRMDPGSVIVDLAAEQGGNCELSEADQRVVRQGVVILGPTNLPAEIPYHASQMFSANVTRFLLHITTDGVIQLDRDDEITSETLVAHGGDIPQARIRELLDLAPLERTPAEQDPTSSPGDLPSPAEDEGGTEPVEDSTEDLSPQLVQGEEDGAELKFTDQPGEEEAEDQLHPAGEDDEENSELPWRDSTDENTPDEDPDDPPQQEDEV